MAGPYREKIFGVAIKIETTSGVDSVPTAALNAVRIVGGVAVLEYDFMEAGDRDDAQTGILSGADRAAPAGAYGKITIPIDMKGAGSAYSSSVKPEADALWRMSGFSAGTSFTSGSEFYRYSTLDTAMETATCYFWSGNKLFIMVGAVAMPQISAEVYKVGKLSFAIQGKITSITEASLPSLTLAALIPPAFHSAAAAIGAWTNVSTEPLGLLSAAVNFGTTVGDYSSAGATDGLIGWLVTDRNVTQDLTFYAPALATYNPFTQAALDGGNAILTAWQVGSVPGAYNAVKVEARWAPRAPRQGARNGLVTYTQSGQCKVGGGLAVAREVLITYPKQ